MLVSRFRRRHGLNEHESDVSYSTDRVLVALSQGAQGQQFLRRELGEAQSYVESLPVVSYGAIAHRRAFRRGDDPLRLACRAQRSSR